jgi:acetyl esterase
MLFKRGICSLASFLLSMTIGFSAPLSGQRHKIEYSQAAGTPLFMDASIPEGSGPFAAAIVVHGGGWVRGDRYTDVAPLLPPLTRAGIAWFSIDYRLSGDISQLGAAVQDVENAIRFVKAHAAEYRVDPERIALVGESAGGQLAAMAALVPENGLSVKAVVALYAPTNLAELAETSNFVPSQIRDALKGTPFANVILARLGQLSPVNNIQAGAPPFLLIHGTDDALVPFSQSKVMCERLKAAGASCELYPVEGGGHGIRWWEATLPRESEGYKREMVRWLKENLGAGLAGLRDRPRS